MRNPSPSTSSSSKPRTKKPAKKKTTPCCSKVGLKRGQWTPEEDEILVNYINKEGEGRWRTLPKRAGLLRCGKSCRLRWMNYLRPSVKRGHIGSDEEDIIIRLHHLLGNRWSLIAGRLPGRTDNEIKNYWNTHLRKTLISQGIDPRTHKPLNLSSNADKIEASSSAVGALTCSPPTGKTVYDIDGTIYKQENNNRSIGDNHHNKDQYNHPIHIQIQTNHQLVNDDDDEDDGDDDDDDYCTEDALSSFLSSLINEDPFGNTSQQVQQHDLAGDGVGAK